MSYVYEERPLTGYVARQLDQRFSRYQGNNFFVICNLQTGYGKTYIGLKTFANIYPNAHIIVFTVAKQVNARHWEQSVSAFNRTTGCHLQVASYSYQRLVGKQYQALKPACQRFAAGNQPCFIILDECQLIKNAKSATFRNLLRLLRACPIRRVLGLSATPVGNHITDMFSYFILNGYATSYTDMVQRYVKCVQPPFHKVVAVHDPQGRLDWVQTFNDGARLQQAYHSFVYYLDAPASMYPPLQRHYVNITLTAAERAAYRQIVRTYRQKLVSVANDGTVLAFENYGQFASALGTFLGTRVSRKDAYVTKVFTSTTRPACPLIIFYKYAATQQHLHDLLTALGAHVFTIDGHMRTRAKRQLSARLNSTARNDVILIQYAAGGAGLNIAQARIAIMYEACTSYIRFLQAEGRNFRAYQSNTVYQLVLRTAHTYESQIYQRVIHRAARFNQQLAVELLQHELHRPDPAVADETADTPAADETLETPETADAPATTDTPDTPQAAGPAPCPAGNDR